MAYSDSTFIGAIGYAGMLDIIDDEAAALEAETGGGATAASGALFPSSGGPHPSFALDEPLGGVTDFVVRDESGENIFKRVPEVERERKLFTWEEDGVAGLAQPALPDVAALAKSLCADDFVDGAQHAAPAADADAPTQQQRAA